MSPKGIMAASPLIFLTGCASFWQGGKTEAFPIYDVTERRAPVLTHSDTRYTWDNDASFALNISRLDGGHSSLHDTDTPELSQRNVSRGQRIGGFLINTWLGTATQAAAHDRVTAGRQEALRFDPFGYIFVDATQYDNQLRHSEDGGFNEVFQLLHDDVKPILVDEYQDETVDVLMWNRAVDDHLNDTHNVRWERDNDFVITSHGAACEAGRDVSAWGAPAFESGNTYAPLTMTGLAAPEFCRTYGQITPQGYVSIDGKDKYAFKVTLSNNFMMVPIAQHSMHTWVISTHWQDIRYTQGAKMPFVTYQGDAWLFTHNNENFPLSEL